MSAKLLVPILAVVLGATFGPSTLDESRAATVKPGSALATPHRSAMVVRTGAGAFETQMVDVATANVETAASLVAPEQVTASLAITADERGARPLGPLAMEAGQASRGAQVVMTRVTVLGPNGEATATSTATVIPLITFNGEPLLPR